MKKLVTVLLVAAVLIGTAALPARAAASRAEATQWSLEDPSFPFRWNPCAPIPYRVNLGGTSRRNLHVVERAIKQVARATGFTFVYAGSTRSVPFARGRSAARQIPGQGLVIAWTTPRRVPALAGDVVGIGGPGASYHRDQTGWEITSAGVAIDRAAAAHLPRGMVDGPSLMSLLLHELGHAMGLGHVASKSEVMHEGLGPWSRPHYGPGDLAGLAALGAARGCF
ncbi:matrixin family metalloprotease [Nocardioides sp.]|jgi:hypothetical protein|uniref:matrixin family metalloprotease n=1 Tax=Nocardioides sp. TaxID=35761 RepID=UPI002BDE6E25|nr:matrixin family metalloprotease [Nocardioides sp.]HVX52923.1 matrixin family metalloprotease [Nocardioides sp.]